MNFIKNINENYLNNKNQFKVFHFFNLPKKKIKLSLIKFIAYFFINLTIKRVRF